MVDIGKQIQHWRSGADEDWAVAEELIEHDDYMARIAEVLKCLNSLF